MNKHVLMLDFDGGIYSRLICKEPKESLCHARWKCDCEEWVEAGIKDGKPWHKNYVEYGEPNICTGYFGRDCMMEDWYDEELMGVGTIEIDVEPEWQGDGYTFLAVGLTKKEET